MISFNNAREFFDQIILLNMRLIAYGDVNETFTKDLLQKHGGRERFLLKLPINMQKNILGELEN